MVLHILVEMRANVQFVKVWGVACNFLRIGVSFGIFLDSQSLLFGFANCS